MAEPFESAKLAAAKQLLHQSRELGDTVAVFQWEQIVQEGESESVNPFQKGNSSVLPDKSPQRQLDESRIEIQRLRNKLGRLREAARGRTGRVLVSVDRKTWGEVMEDV